MPIRSQTVGKATTTWISLSKKENERRMKEGKSNSIKRMKEGKSNSIKRKIHVHISTVTVLTNSKYQLCLDVHKCLTITSVKIFCLFKNILHVYTAPPTCFFYRSI